MLLWSEAHLLQELVSVYFPSRDTTMRFDHKLRVQGLETHQLLSGDSKLPVTLLPSICSVCKTLFYLMVC